MERHMRIRGYAPLTPNWVELASADPARAAQFYGELFGWESAGDRFKLNGRAVAGLTRSGADRPDGWLTHLSTPDLEDTLEQVALAGGTCVSHPADAHGGRRAIVADPAGALIGLWEPTDFAGAQAGGEPGTMSWPELITDDPHQAARFYGSAFGWLLRHDFGVGEWLNQAHDAIAGLTSGYRGAWWRAAFQVEDISAAVDHCERLGGALLAEPTEDGLTEFAVLRDPFGARFTVAAPVHHPVELTVSLSSMVALPAFE
ncbi:bleomycin resistance protein [Actinoplanes awajinensis subsp. mycoplanecinus]|uniref:Bleomycin resistance protein n=2 Tax=Actinoplanes TaxID=1865 RepID=A0A0X3V521_9ACTN|nr:bleomycin resistance protein [Actinoplanes awajinensis subsp. mycoplanecinus]